MKVLFIGGHADGEMKDVKSDADSTSICPASEQDFIPTNHDSVSYEIHVYHRQTLQGHEKSFDIMVLQGMTGDEVIKALLTGYRQPKKVKK